MNRRPRMYFDKKMGRMYNLELINHTRFQKIIKHKYLKSKLKFCIYFLAHARRRGNENAEFYVMEQIRLILRI